MLPAFDAYIGAPALSLPGKEPKQNALVPFVSPQTSFIQPYMPAAENEPHSV